jgi:uncharacterized protein (DUF2345 family)
VEYSDGIVSRTTGVHLRHAAAHPHKGAASISAQLPGMPRSEMKTSEQFALVGRSGKAWLNQDYEIRDDQGEVESTGATGGDGGSAMTSGNAITQVRMKVEVPEASAGQDAPGSETE